MTESRVCQAMDPHFRGDDKFVGMTGAWGRQARGDDRIKSVPFYLN